MKSRRSWLVFITLAVQFISIFEVAPARAALYSFTTHTFTPCGTTGNSGPTLSSCQTSYSATTWKNDSSLFNVSSGIQLWTVPVTGSFRITATGGGGGTGKQSGGKGASISGEFSLTQGAILKILVGQAGSAYATGSGGGGGGTFVATNSNSALIVAGGGGGGGGSASSTHIGQDATYLTTATAATRGGTGGSTSAGGTGDSVNYSGGGGGGVSANGGGAIGTGGGLGSTGGAGFGGDGGLGQNDSVIPKSFTNGGAGGYRSSGSWGNISTSFGGFGGGGNGTAATYESGGGGGGGYAGGGGGTGLYYGGGGGGGSSYNSGTNTQNISITNTGAGSVVIAYLNPDQTPPTITSSSTFNTNENTLAIGSATANETSTWFLSAGLDSLTVSIDSVTGVIVFKNPQNFESPGDADSNRIYLFTIRAIDEAGNSSTAAISVNILDVNEAPTISSNGGGATASISMAENASTVTTVLSTDPDSVSALSYSISGVDSSDFAIGVVSGVLTFATPPNYEVPVDSDTNNVYVVVVNVTDGNLSDSQTITISITNISETVGINSMTFSSPPAKGNQITITTTFDTAGKVTYLANGKKIPGCISKAVSGSLPVSSNCQWKPNVSGTVLITLSITPSDSNFVSTVTPAVKVTVSRRSNIR